MLQKKEERKINLGEEVMRGKKRESRRKKTRGKKLESEILANRGGEEWAKEKESKNRIEYTVEQGGRGSCTARHLKNERMSRGEKKTELN